MCGHPAFGAKKSLQQRRQVQIGVELRKMQAEPGWTDLDRGQLCALALSKPCALRGEKAMSMPLLRLTTTRSLRRS
jgi:hypothetical protein